MTNPLARLRRSFGSLQKRILSETRTTRPHSKQQQRSFGSQLPGLRTPKFWGAAGASLNFGIVGASLYDAADGSLDRVSLNMTGALAVWSLLFMRWSWRIVPRNHLLFLCHFVNVGAQSFQWHRKWQSLQFSSCGREIISVEGGESRSFAPSSSSAEKKSIAAASDVFGRGEEIIC